jgi:hypothetical protein
MMISSDGTRIIVTGSTANATHTLTINGVATQVTSDATGSLTSPLKSSASIASSTVPIFTTWNVTSGIVDTESDSNGKIIWQLEISIGAISLGGGIE